MHLIGLAAEGADIAIDHLSNKVQAEAVAHKVKDHGVNAICVQGDCSVGEDNASIARATLKAFGTIDVVIANNAWTRFASFSGLNDLTAAEWQKV